jgi:hypothetical protein
MNYSYDQHADAVIQTYGLKRKSGNEYGDKPCPNCGGTDRFWINEYRGDLTHHCRQECDFLERQAALQRDGALPIDADPTLNEEHRNSEPTAYHEHKRIDLQGSGAVCDGNTVVIELCDIVTGEPRGRQFIRPDGSKKFTPKLQKEGTGTFIGPATDTVYVTEGWADAVTVHRATGQQALFALDAGNIPKTVAILQNAGRKVIVAADADEAGINAAKAAGVPYAVPPTGKDWWDVFDAEGLDAVAQGLAGASKNPSMQLFDHVLDISLEPPKWLIDGILPEYSMTALLAPSYTGKSYLAVDMACSIATGHKWHDQCEVTAGNVFYVVGEGRFGIRRRVEAWHRDRGISLDRETTNLHFSRQGLNFRDPNSIASIKADLRLVNDVKLIIVDTLARSFGGGNENAPQDMGEFIQGCDDLMHEFEATVLVVHHFGKDTQSGARGHSSFFGALDTSMTLKKIGAHDIQLACEKQKDAPEFEKLQFTFVTMGGTDETPVLHMVPTSQAPTGPKLGKNEQLALDTYAEATEGRSPRCRLHLEEWRPFFLKRHTGDTIKAKNDAFSRARRSLDTKGFLQVDDDFYTLGDKATFGDKQQNVARQNHSAGDATDIPF